MSTFRRDFETDEQYRKRIASDEPQTFETDIGKVLDATPEIVVQPGSHHARNAMRLNADDEYANRMRNRYGGEW